MPEPSLFAPFGDDPIQETPLAAAPLLKVVSQVRWQSVSTVKYEFERIAKELGLGLSELYPLVATGQELQIALGSEGVRQRAGGIVQKYQSVDSSWSVSLNETFLALETTNYSSRTDFCNRLAFALQKLENLVKIPKITRLGFRYVNRIDDKEMLANLGRYVNEVVLGGGQVPLCGKAQVRHSLTETLYDLGQEQILVRWATLPAGGTIDPTITPSQKDSWVLDLDAFTETPYSFAAQDLAEKASALALAGYRLFRWCVTDEFIEAFKE